MDGLSIKVKMNDGFEKTYVLTAKVIVGYEFKYGKGFSKLLEDMKYEHLCWLAWKSLHLDGVTVKPFNNPDQPGFLDDLAEAELVTDDSFGSTETA